MPEKKRKDKRTRDEVPEEEGAESHLDLDQKPKGEYDKTEDHPTNFVLVDTGTNQIHSNPLDPESTDDSMTVGTDEDGVMSRIDDYTDDPDTLEDFAERQRTGAGSDQLLNKFTQHHSLTPETSGDDIDASWESDNQSGEESVGGTVITPDQDIVEELGEAVGLEYEFDEPLDTAGKLEDRDQNRWEMNPESAGEAEEELEDEEPDLEDMLEDMDAYDDEDLLSVAEELSDLEEEEDKDEDIEDEGYTITDEDVIEDEDLLDDEDDYDIESELEDEEEEDLIIDEEEEDEEEEEEDEDELYDEEFDEDEFEFDEDDLDDLYDDDDDY